MKHAILGAVGDLNAQVTAAHFIDDCRSRSGSEEIYQQSYLCNPQGAATASIVEWSAIERCRYDYPIERVHLEANEILQLFGHFNPATEHQRENQIHQFLQSSFPALLAGCPGSSIQNQKSEIKNLRLGFDVAASGQGDLAVIYIDQFKDSALWLKALLSARTEDWHFLKTALFYLVEHLPNLIAAADESGLGRQICWEAAERFSSRFIKVNFASKKSDVGFCLMNQLSVAEKRFPRSEQDVAADFFALRKLFNGSRWVFAESRNTFNPASHCDIAWAAALASCAHTEKPCQVGAMVVYDTEEEQRDAANNRLYHWDRQNPKQVYALGCAFCAHRPGHFNPPPQYCQKCRIYLTTA